MKSFFQLFPKNLCSQGMSPGRAGRPGNGGLHGWEWLGRGSGLVGMMAMHPRIGAMVVPEHAGCTQGGALAKGTATCPHPGWLLSRWLPRCKWSLIRGWRVLGQRCPPPHLPTQTKAGATSPPNGLTIGNQVLGDQVICTAMPTLSGPTMNITHM